jgi:hypothetical protein
MSVALSYHHRRRFKRQQLYIAERIELAALQYSDVGAEALSIVSIGLLPGFIR